MSVTIRDEECAAIADGFARALKPGPHGDPIIESQDGGTFVVRGSKSGRRFRISVVELASAGASDTLRMMRALASVLIDDSENEPPDFTVIEDDGFGLGEA